MVEPEDVVAYNLGVRLFREGKVLEALEKFRFAAATGEDRPMEHFALASACLQIGDKDGAEREYRRFLDMNPTGQAQINAARKAIGRFEKERVAAKALEEAHRKAREERLRKERLEGVQRLYAEAVAFFRVGGYDSCLKRLDSLAQSWGRTPEVLNLMALCHKKLDAPEQAMKLFQEALSAAPGDTDASLNLAQLYFESGVKRARQLIEVVLKNEPDHGPAWYNFGVMALAEGHHDEARQAFARAVELDPGDQLAQARLKLLSADK
jgi:tetratricopeptide (TPR) repeat protein